MLTKACIAFFGMIVGGVSFLSAGFAVFLTIGQIENGAIAARAPAPHQEQAKFAQFLPKPQDLGLSSARN